MAAQIVPVATSTTIVRSAQTRTAESSRGSLLMKTAGNSGYLPT
jgi:hypothetical protein